MESRRLSAVPHRVNEGCAVDSDSDRGKKGESESGLPPAGKSGADDCVTIQALVRVYGGHTANPEI